MPCPNRTDFGITEDKTTKIIEEKLKSQSTKNIR